MTDRERKQFKEDLYDVTYNVQLAETIVEARIKRGLTQKQLARRIGTLQPAIARIEAGNVPPSHQMIKKIAKVLEMRAFPPVLKDIKNNKKF